MKSIFSISLLSLILLFECNYQISTVSDPASGSVNESLYLSKIYTTTEDGPKIRHLYLYDNNSVLQKHIFYSSDTFVQESQTFHYNANGKVNRIDEISDVSGPPTYSYIYSYNLYHYGTNGQIERSECYLKVADNYEFRGFTKFYFDSIGQIIKSCQYLPDSTLKIATDYKYDTKGNIITSDSTSFEYDNQKNPYPSFNLPEVSAYNSSKNNTTKWIYSDSSIDEIHYEYNEEGYPIRSFENGNELIYEYIRKQ